MTYDGLPERWAPYEPTPEPEREHIEIRTLGSPYCLCYECAEKRPAGREVVTNHDRERPNYADLIAPYVAAQVDRLAAEARAMMPRPALPDPARGAHRRHRTPRVYGPDDGLHRAICHPWVIVVSWWWRRLRQPHPHPTTRGQR